jgi:hypothetical protein
MNVGPATYPAPFTTGQRFDPVRSRVVVRQQLTNDQMLQANAEPHASAAPHPMRLLPDTRGGGPRRPHPGDVLYWVACLGGACLLIVLATT